MTIPSIENASAPLLAALAESAIRGLLVALAIGLVLTLFRVRRTVWRLSAWTIVLFAALAMPALGRVVPSLSLPIANVPALAWMRPAAPNALPNASGAALERPASTSSRIGSTLPPTHSASSATSGVSDSTSLRSSSATSQLPSLSVVLLGLYLIGMFAFIVRAAIGWIATRQLERDARPIDDADVLAQLARISHSADCRKTPRLAESDRLHVPVTVSVVQPMVILPDTWRSWDGSMLDAVLTHEVSHVARHDALTQRGALLYRAIFWFNPLAWWLQHHLTDLAEQASDEAVLGAGTNQTYYARVLLEFFRALPQAGYRANWHVAMARGAAANAEARVDRILAWKGGQAMRLTKSMVMSVVLAALPVVALTAAVRPAPVAADQQAPVVAVQTVAAPTPPMPSQAQPAPSPASLPAWSPSGAHPTVNVRTPGLPAEVNPGTQSATQVTVGPTPEPQVPPTVATPIPAEVARGGMVDRLREYTTQGDFGAGIYKPGQGVSWPKVISESKPEYSDEAQKMGLQGAVELDIIVLPDGSVGPVRITKSLDARYGLDGEAVRAARQWIFEPAQFGGQPVAVIVGLVLEFRLPSQSGAHGAGESRPARPRPLADAFATGAYSLISSALVAPQPAGDRGRTNPDVSLESLRFGLTAPTIRQQAVPKYTPDAMRAKLQGQVEVEAIVMPDGTVGKVRVVQSLNRASGLDEAALAAARQSTFTPGTLDGTPVPVLVTLRFDFRLH